MKEDRKEPTWRDYAKFVTGLALFVGCPGALLWLGADQLERRWSLTSEGRFYTYLAMFAFVVSIAFRGIRRNVGFKRLALWINGAAFAAIILAAIALGAMRAMFR